MHLTDTSIEADPGTVMKDPEIVDEAFPEIITIGVAAGRMTGPLDEVGISHRRFHCYHSYAVDAAESLCEGRKELRAAIGAR